MQTLKLLFTPCYGMSKGKPGLDIVRVWLAVTKRPPRAVLASPVLRCALGARWYPLGADLLHDGAIYVGVGQRYVRRVPIAKPRAQGT